MKVSELIRILLRMPQDAEIETYCSEQGWWEEALEAYQAEPRDGEKVVRIY